MNLIKRIILAGSILLAGACSTTNISREAKKINDSLDISKFEIDLQGYRTTAKGFENLKKIHEILYGDFNKRTFRKICYLVDKYPFGILTEEETEDYLTSVYKFYAEQ